MKINIIRIILIMALIVTFCIIFGFSNQDSKTSGGMSQKITDFVIKFIPSIQQTEENQKEEIIDRIESVIRKIAHFSIYTLVGFLLMSLMGTYKMKEIDQIGTSLIIGVIYASTDEIHQAFIPGRGPQITDVMLDSLGVLTGIFIAILLLEIFRKINNNRLKILT